MTTAVATTTTESAKPLERAAANVHQLLRRSMRLVEPKTLEEEAERGAALRQLNEDAQAYFEWKEIEEEAKRYAAALKPTIEALTLKLGHTPDSAPKTRRLETANYICNVTTGTSTEIDHEQVLELDMFMATPSQQRLFNQLFTRQVRYSLASGAKQLIQHGDLPAKIADDVRARYALAFSPKTTAASLTVESKAAIAAKREKASAEAPLRKAAKVINKKAAKARKAGH